MINRIIPNYKRRSDWITLQGGELCLTLGKVLLNTSVENFVVDLLVKYADDVKEIHVTWSTHLLWCCNDGTDKTMNTNRSKTFTETCIYVAGRVREIPHLSHVWIKPTPPNDATINICCRISSWTVTYKNGRKRTHLQMEATK